MTDEKIAVGKRSLWQCGSQFQQVTKGMIECPKCFGAGELDLTRRDVTGWPISSCARMTCDHCDGESEVQPEMGVDPNAKPGVSETGWATYQSPERINKPNIGWESFNK